MTEPAVRVNKLSKLYRIGLADKSPQSLRGAVRAFLGAPFKYLNHVLRPPTEDEILWALKDISFEIQRGEVLGIIGRNGAGKSTLLKILSRITEPTEGYAEIRGRVASLLEVGTGFNPELTGRENVYLNGTIMGMTRREIDRKFDEIVDFAEVSKFIDTPVKRYSSGMHVRLGFAVAAHLEPEILIVDEVLAVGDFVFQKKCLAKVRDMSSHDGRTVIFVSHSMQSMLSLCDQCLHLHKGRMVAFGKTTDIVADYLAQYRSDADIPIRERTDREVEGPVVATDLRFLDPRTGEPLTVLLSGQDLCIEIGYQARDASVSKLKSLIFSLDFFNSLGHFVLILKSDMSSHAFVNLPPEGTVHCFVPKFPFMNGTYYVNLSLYMMNQLVDKVGYARVFNVDGDYFGYGIQDEYSRQGVYTPHSWVQGAYQ